MSLESDWQDRKTLVYANIYALLDAGIPLEQAKSIAAWNPTLAYDTFADMQDGTGLPTNGLRDFVRLKVTRSPARVGSGELNGAGLDAGKLYAIFIDDVPELNFTKVEFLLDGSPVHTEFSSPWDYAGTVFDGSANRVSFVSDSYEIEASITDMYGIFSVSSSFIVD